MKNIFFNLLIYSSLAVFVVCNSWTSVSASCSRWIAANRQECLTAESEKTTPCKRQEQDLDDRRIPVQQKMEGDGSVPISGCALEYQIWSYICSTNDWLKLRQLHATEVSARINNALLDIEHKYRNLRIEQIEKTEGLEAQNDAAEELLGKELQSLRKREEAEKGKEKSNIFWEEEGKLVDKFSDMREILLGKIERLEAQNDAAEELLEKELQSLAEREEAEKRKEKSNIFWEEEGKLFDKFSDMREVLQEQLRANNKFLAARTVLDDREKSEKPEKGWIQKTIADETTYTYHLYQLAKNIIVWNQMRYRAHIATLTETEIERINVLQLVNNIKQHARTAAQLMYIYHSPVNMLDQLLEAIIACLYRNLEINNGVRFRKYDAYLGYQKPEKECADYEFRIMREDIEDIIARQLEPLVLREWRIDVNVGMEVYRKKAVEITYLLTQDVNDLITGKDIRHSRSRVWTDEQNIRRESGSLCCEILCMIESNPKHEILLDLTRSLFRAADTKELGLSLEDETSKQQDSSTNSHTKVVTSSFRSVKTALDQGDEGASRESNWISAATQDIGSYTYALYRLAVNLVEWERMMYRAYTAANKSIAGAERRLQKICSKERGTALLDKIKQCAKKARAQIKCFNAETDKSFKLDDLLETVILCLHEQDKDLVSIQCHEKTETVSTGGNKANLGEERAEVTVTKKIANDKYLGCIAADNNLTDEWITTVEGYLRSTFFSKSNSNEVIEEIVGIFNDIIDQRSKNKWADREWMKQTTVITRSFQQNTGDGYTSHMLKKGYVLFESSEKYILKEGPELFEINELLYEKPTHEVLEELLTDLCGRSVSPQSFQLKSSVTTSAGGECDNEIIAEDEEECTPTENEREIPSKPIAANPSSSSSSLSSSSCPDSREQQVAREQALQKFNEKTLSQRVNTLEELVKKLQIAGNQKTVMQDIVDQLSANLLDSGLSDMNTTRDNPLHGILEQTYTTLANAEKSVDIEAVSLLIKLIHDHVGCPGVPKIPKSGDNTWLKKSGSPVF